MPPENVTHTDYQILAQAVDEMRELFRAQVAGLVDDGFTDREARELVTAIWRGQNRD